MEQILALLLPIAAVSGWFAATKHFKKKSLNNLHKRNLAYFQGLNHLFDERPDKALDVFVFLLEDGNETVETHLALGSLFRKRGEIERAISIHKRLVDRKDLCKDQQRQVLFELGMDYLRAGLYGRAEALFLQLVGAGAFKKAALQQLLYLYQQEKEWFKAIEYKRKLDQIGGGLRGESAAQFYCELALESYEKGDKGKAAEFIEHSLRENKCCVRASLIAADMWMDQDYYDHAIESLKRVENQDPVYLCEAINPLIKCFENVGGGGKHVSYLNYLYDQYSIPGATAEIAKLLERNEGDDRAIEFLLETLNGNTTIQGIDVLVTMLMTRSNEESRKILSKLSDICSKLLTKQAFYQCAQCGFSCNQIHWRCPSCHHWETIKPVVIEL